MLPTGLTELDRKLRGGLHPGSLVAYTAPPDTQSALFLEQVARSNESTYVTTIHEAETITDRLPETTVVEASDDDLLAAPETYLEVPDGGCLVVDAVTGLEADEEAYRAFLDVAARRCREADGAVLLYAHEVERDPPGRWLTFARADVTMRLSLVVNPLAVETRLAVTKNRHGAALTEPLKLRLTDHVSIDSSRDI